MKFNSLQQSAPIVEYSPIGCEDLLPIVTSGTGCCGFLPLTVISSLLLYHLFPSWAVLCMFSFSECDRHMSKLRYMAIASYPESWRGRLHSSLTSLSTCPVVFCHARSKSYPGAEGLGSGRQQEDSGLRRSTQAQLLC